LQLASCDGRVDHHTLLVHHRVIRVFPALVLRSPS
jgi:hypothetical protein